MSNNKISPVTVYAMEDAEPEAPTLSRNLLDEAGLWKTKLITTPEGGKKEGK